MLNIMLSATDDSDAVELSMEHSLVSLSKWEELYEKPFFGPESKTPEETSDYIRCMILGNPPPENFLDRMVRDDFELVTGYINAKRTATTFTEEPSGPKGSREVVTSELIYYWLVSFNIPFHPVETWHLNRLMTLVRIAGVKQTKPKRMSQKEVMERNHQLNAQRKKESGTSG